MQGIRILLTVVLVGWAFAGAMQAQTVADASEGIGGGTIDRAAAEAVATRELERAVQPMLIEDRVAVPAPGAPGGGVPVLRETDPILAAMYEGMDLVLDEAFEEAIPYLELVIKREPTLIPVWSTLGWTYWRVGRQKDAIRLWQQFLQLDPNHAMAHLLVGNAYVGTGQLDQGEHHLKRSLELDPEQIEPRLVLATIYRWTGRYSASRAILEALRAEYPDRLDIQNELGSTLFENGSYHAALPLLEQAVRAQPDNMSIARLHALCLLRTGNLTEARLRAQRLLRGDNANLELLLLLADAPIRSGEPEQAIPYLQELVASSVSDDVRAQAHEKLIQIYGRLRETNPRAYPVELSLDSSRALLEIDPEQPYWRVMHAELLLMNGQYDKASRVFARVMAYATTNVLAAREGLFEIGQATTRYADAKEHWSFLQDVDPNNPYLNEKLSRMELSRGNVRGAQDALDRLERQGAHGAVAVLLYYGLSESDWSETLSARRFRLHLLALKQAGYRFIAPSELEAYFSSLPRPPEDVRDHRPERVAMVTFDRIDEKTVRLATKVAQDLDLVFGVHLAARDILDPDADQERLDAMRDQLRGEHWEVGSLLYDAIELQPVREDGRLGSTLAARRWLEEEDMYESESDFTRRLQYEYAESRKKLREWLGEGATVAFMAYPYGDFGLGVLNNIEDAYKQNVREAAVNYRMAFIQTVFGHAVSRDNPMLYQRYTPGAFDDGQDVVDHLLSHHPVFMARRLRAELAALQGALYAARRNLALLRRDDYPKRPYAKTEAFVYENLALKFGVARAIPPTQEDLLRFEPGQPFLGGDFTYYRDSLERRNWQNSYYAGLYVTPVITLEGRGGYGRYRQQYSINLADEDETPVLEDRSASVTERFVGAHLALRYQPENPRTSPVTFAAGARRHAFRDSADYDMWAWFVQAAMRPFLMFDVLLGVNREAVPSARSLTESLSQDRYSYAGSFRLRDWWDIWTRVNYLDVSDDNNRVDANISSMWELVPASGVLAGLEYGYVDAKNAADDYWTPYRLQQYFLVGRLRNNIHRFSYDVGVKIGRARERIRPETQAAYDRLVERAERFRFDPGDPPETDWENIFAANAVLTLSLGRYWRANWEGAYTESANFHEYRTTAGISAQF